MKTLSRFLHLRLQGARTDLPVYNGFLDKPDPPAPPDYAAAAKQQGQDNLNAAIATGVLNRPNEVNPFGSRTWDQTGTYMVDGKEVPIFTGTTSLTDVGQNLLNKDLNLKTGLMDLGQQSLDRVGAGMSSPIDFSGATPANAGNRDAVTNALYERHKRMLDPQFEQRADAMRSDLANRGFSVGDKGYETAIGNFNRSRDEAYDNARTSSIAAGGVEAQRDFQTSLAGRQQDISEILAQRKLPLEEMNAIRTGAMPQVPSFQPYAGAGPVNAAPTFAGAQATGNAAMQQFGIESDMYNNTLSGLFRLGAAGIMA